MKKKSGYRISVWLMILSGIALAVILAITSSKVIYEDKRFTQFVLEDNKTFLVNTLRFGHGMMAHTGTESYESLIDLALKSEFILSLAILDEQGRLIAQGSDAGESVSLSGISPAKLEDEAVLRETDETLLISYKAKQIVTDEEHRRHHATFKGHSHSTVKPGWFLVAVDISGFKKHHRDMVTQTVGVGIIFLLFGALVIVYFGIIGRYELAHLSIERLSKIKSVLGNFVPEIAKNMIEKDPEKALLNRYVQDATVLFLDIEGSTTLLQRHPQETVNHVIESYFSKFFDLIRRNGGDVNETAGDGMMVIFLDPDPVKHAQNAVRTAVEIQDYCVGISETGDSNLFPIQVNIGISSGEVHLGSTKMRGTERDRWTFTASGATTILAARLSDCAYGGQTLASEETARRIQEQYVLVNLGEVPLKNLEDSGQLFQVMTPQAEG